MRTVIGDLNTAEIYDPSTGKWTPTGNMTATRSQGHAAVLLKDGKVLDAAGHGEGFNSAELYDPLTGVWSPTGFPTTPRYWTSAVLLKDGRALLFGGFGLSGVTTAAEIYDPISGRWSVTGSMNVDRYVTQKGVLLKDSRVLVACGHHANGSGERSTEIFDPAS